MSTVDIGGAAETAASEKLVRQGFVILARNWKTRYCEVDIIAKKDGVVWFIEVKYRKTEKCGDGLEYIGSQKLRHLQIAAALWVEQHRYMGEYVLGAVAVTGNNIIGTLVEI